MRYLIYLRVSTKEQDTRSQLDYCMKYLSQKHEHQFEYKVFADEITSKKSIFKREGSSAMIKEMLKGDTIVSIRVDRLSRIQSDTTKFMDVLDHKQVNIILIDQPGISNKIMLGIYSGMAEEEIVTLKKRIKEKFDSKRQRNERIGTVPYGYKLDMNLTIPVKVGKDVVLKPGVMVPDPYEQEVIAHLQLLEGQGYSYRVIANKVTELGYLSRVKKPLQFRSIHRILSRINKPKGHSQSHPVEECQSALVSQ